MTATRRSSEGSGRLAARAVTDDIRLADLDVVDPDGDAWHRDALERFLDPEPLDPPPLPEWTAPDHVTRGVYGRFLQDRDTRVVHDIHQATPECAVDEIRHGTFFHFWSEVLADPSVAADHPCPRCMSSI